MPETVSCNLCGSDHAKPLFTLRDYRLHVDEIAWTVVKCRSCGLGYLNPRPTLDEIARYYPSSYFDRRSLQRKRYEKQAQFVTQTPGRLLDVGAAGGDFLAVMETRGWQVIGIEPYADVARCTGATVYRERFPKDGSLPEADFDAITAWAVFEHLHDPYAAFCECARALRPGGSLIVQVPNLASIHSRWAMQEDIPRHLYFFTPRTLRSYGTKVGLQLRRVVHTTNLFGGSGRGVLCLLLVQALGKSLDDFFEIYKTPRRERFRRWPALSFAWSGVAAVERVLLADWIVRRLHLSGQVVAEFVKPASTPTRSNVRSPKVRNCGAFSNHGSMRKSV